MSETLSSKERVRETVERLSVELPYATISIDEPQHPEGHYFIDIVIKKIMLVIEIYSNCYGISIIDPKFQFYGLGEKPDFVYSSLEGMMKRLREFVRQ